MSLQSKLESIASEGKLGGIYKKVFSSEEGQLVLQDLTNRFNPQVPDVMEDVQVDPFRTHINVGKRSVMFHISTMLLPDEIKNAD